MMGGLLDLPFLLVIMEDINDKVSNIYIIRRRLAELKQVSDTTRYEYHVENKFTVAIWIDRIQDYVSGINPSNENIVSHDVVDVIVYEREAPSEKYPHGDQIWVRLDRDDRFMNYQPIRYGEINHLCSGDRMPINQLCELIKYLYKLEKLSVFL